MKIISLEKFDKNEVVYALKKDLLIACYTYQIPIETSRNKELNFIEKTVLKLIQLDDSLKHDTIRLSNRLGFFSDNEADDKTKIVSLILKKLKDLRIDSIENDDEKTEVKVYQFYQEAYTGKLLPIITEEQNTYSFPTNEYNFNENFNYKEVSFKAGIDAKRKTKAVLVKDFNSENDIKKPTKLQIVETIFKHNQSKYKGSHKIDVKQFNIDLLKPELLYLHTKLYILKDNIDSFVITNGFTNDFSTVLRKLFSERHSTLLPLLRKNIRVDTDNRQDKVEVPFEKSIIRYKIEKKLIVTIEKETLTINNTHTNKETIKASKSGLIASLYDLIELLFKRLSKDDSDSDSLKKRELLENIAKDIGFEINDKYLHILKVHSGDNLQKYLAKSLLYKKKELYDIASNYPDFLFVLSKLLKLRNGVKHSEKDKALENVDILELDEYKVMTYYLVTIILKIKNKNIEHKNLDTYNIELKQNALLNLEEELHFDIVCKLPEEIKKNLVNVNYFLSLDFESNKYTIVKEVINNLYSSFEFILKKVVNTLDIVKEAIPAKEDLLAKVRERNELNESLYRVSPKMIENAFNKKPASLGAYMLVYLYYKSNTENAPKNEYVSLIEIVLAKRGHSSPTDEDLQNTNLKELQNLKELSFKHIEILIAEL
ncbi:hypothetical protein V6246_00745 [Algibacter sp. TI.3.09]|uniref:hypothetical protein n=1 Tax=Algibacter sp. TI.3.09 TaxID=3121298 RepID=UPI00311F27F7